MAWGSLCPPHLKASERVETDEWPVKIELHWQS